MRYGIKYPDGGYSGEITDSFRLIQNYASQHGGVVYDSENPDDPIWREAVEFWKEQA